MELIIIFNKNNVSQWIGGVPLGEDKPKSHSGVNMAFNVREDHALTTFGGIVYPTTGGKKRAFRVERLKRQYGNKGGQNRHTGWGQPKTSSADNFVYDHFCANSYKSFYNC